MIIPRALPFAALLTLSAVCFLAAPEATPGQDAGKVITNSIDMKLALVPAGKFLMGSPATEEERNGAEVQHEVAITRPFLMGIYPVTQAQSDKVLNKNSSFFHAKNGGSPDHPVDQVQWADAVEFCQIGRAHV